MPVKDHGCIYECNKGIKCMCTDCDYCLYKPDTSDKKVNTTTGKQLERKINRAKKILKSLEENEENLSMHGYWSIGYLQGKISVLEDWLDEIKEGDENL